MLSQYLHHEFIKQLIKRGIRIGQKTGMRTRSLDNRTTNGCQPTKTLRNIQSGNRSSITGAGTDSIENLQVPMKSPPYQSPEITSLIFPREARILPGGTFSVWRNKIIPTLINSSRSTRGTTRITAYSYKYLSSMLCFFYKYFRMCNPLR